MNYLRYILAFLCFACAGRISLGAAQSISPGELRGKLQQSVDFGEVTELLKIAAPDATLRGVAIEYLDNAKYSTYNKFESWLAVRGWDRREHWQEFSSYKKERFNDFIKYTANSGDPKIFELLKHLCESAVTISIVEVEEIGQHFPLGSTLNSEFVDYAYQGTAEIHHIYKEKADGEGGRLAGILNSRTGEYRPYYTPEEENAFQLVKEKSGAFFHADQAILTLYKMKTAEADAAILGILSTDSVWREQGIPLNLNYFFKNERYTERVFPFFMAALRGPVNRYVQDTVRTLMFRQYPLVGAGQRIEEADPAMYPKLLEAIALIETFKLPPDLVKATAELKARILELQAQHPAPPAPVPDAQPLQVSVGSTAPGPSTPAIEPSAASAHPPTIASIPAEPTAAPPRLPAAVLVAGLLLLFAWLGRRK